MLKKDTFLLYKNKIGSIEILSDEQAGKVFKAILRYVNNKDITYLNKNNVEYGVFVGFVEQIDYSDKKYIEKCEQNRKNANKRYENNKQNANVNECMQTHTNAYKKSERIHNDNDIDIDNVNDNVNSLSHDNDNFSEKEREDFYKFLKKQYNAENPQAYISTIKRNGDYKDILQAYKEYNAKIEDKKSQKDIKSDLLKVTDKYSAACFMAKYGDYTDQNNPLEVIEIMEKYGLVSWTQMTEYKHQEEIKRGLSI